MSATTLNTPPDAAAVHRLATALNDCFETFSADADTFADDAFFDLLPPFWRFQLQGPAAFLAQLRTIARGPTTARVLRVVPTASGFVLEHEEVQADATARRLLLCEVRDGRIAEVVVYCNGEWDPALRARHAAEAPMLRPEQGEQSMTAVDQDVSRPATADHVLDAARRLAPTIAERAAEVEAARRVPPDLLRELVAAGVSGSCSPGTRGARAPTCSPRCGCSRPWPRPTGPWAGRR